MVFDLLNICIAWYGSMLRHSFRDFSLLSIGGFELRMR